MRISESTTTPGMWFVIGAPKGIDKIFFVCYSRKKAMEEMKQLNEINKLMKEVK